MSGSCQNPDELCLQEEEVIHCQWITECYIDSSAGTWNLYSFSVGMEIHIANGDLITVMQLSQVN